MREIIQDLQWHLYLSHLADMAVAFCLALPTGWERERGARSAGLRTFPLVAVASCGFVIIGVDIGGDNPDALARVLYGLMTGIGFIGGGAILKSDGDVHGTATAASIWNTGAIGAAVGFGRYEVAIALALLNFLILRVFRPLKRELRP